MKAPTRLAHCNTESVIELQLEVAIGNDHHDLRISQSTLLSLLCEWHLCGPLMVLFPNVCSDSLIKAYQLISGNEPESAARTLHSPKRPSSTSSLVSFKLNQVAIRLLQFCWLTRVKSSPTRIWYLDQSRNHRLVSFSLYIVQGGPKSPGPWALIVQCQGNF